MRFSLLPLLPLALAGPISRAAKPVYWLLAGDSTTAPNGGWGDAFLSTTVASGSSGHNYGHAGATTASFREEDWADVISDIGKNKGEYDVFVTIQFGHNDQKETSGVSLAQYKANIAKFASEVESAGGTPILVTPLTRRSLRDGKVGENLEEQRTTTLAVAQEEDFMFIDLNLASVNYVEAIGQEGADTYNLKSGDRTHLNSRGGVVFARIVSDLIVKGYPEFIPFTKMDETLSATIKAGELA